MNNIFELILFIFSYLSMAFVAGFAGYYFALSKKEKIILEQDRPKIEIPKVEPAEIDVLEIRG
jgi:hypothetical protein